MKCFLSLLDTKTYVRKNFLDFNNKCTVIFFLIFDSELLKMKEIQLALVKHNELLRNFQK